MVVTEFGMATEVRPKHFSKAYLPIEVTVFGITVLRQPTTKQLVDVSIIALQLSRESNTGFPGSTTISISLVQRVNGLYLDTDVTDLGIVTDFN